MQQQERQPQTTSPDVYHSIKEMLGAGFTRQQAELMSYQRFRDLANLASKADVDHAIANAHVLNPNLTTKDYVDNSIANAHILNDNLATKADIANAHILNPNLATKDYVDHAIANAHVLNDNLATKLDIANVLLEIVNSKNDLFKWGIASVIALLTAIVALGGMLVALFRPLIS